MGERREVIGILRLPSMSQEPTALQELIAIAKRGKALIIGFTLFCVVAAVVFTAVRPARFESRASILASQPSPTEISSLRLLGLGQGPQSIQVLRGMLESQEARNRVAERANVAADQLPRLVRVQPVEPLGQLQLVAHTRDRAQGEVILAAMLEVLAELDQEKADSISNQQTAATRNALARKREELDAVEAQLVEFQRTASTVPASQEPRVGFGYAARLEELRTQREAAQRTLQEFDRAARDVAAGGLDTPVNLPHLSALRATYLEAQIQFDLISGEFVEGAAEYRRAAQELEAARTALDAEYAAYARSVSGRVDPELAELQAQLNLLNWEITELTALSRIAPEEAVEFARLLLEAEATGRAYSELTTELERLTVQIEANQVRWTILDSPYSVPDPVNKNFILTGLIALMAGGMVSLVLTLMAYPAPRRAGNNEVHGNG